MDKTRELYIVCDIESDGPVPVLHSMLSLGAVALGWNNNKHDWEVSSRFYRTMTPFPGATQDPETMKWWSGQPTAWTEATKDPVDPVDAMKAFANWCQHEQREWNRKPVGVCAPVGFDFPFIRTYLIHFAKTDEPFRQSCIDMRSVAAEKLKLSYKDTGKGSYPRAWFKDAYEHSHKADEDALEQAFLWARMLDSD